jgi:hypothetical protein
MELLETEIRPTTPTSRGDALDSEVACPIEDLSIAATDCECLTATFIPGPDACR